MPTSSPLFWTADLSIGFRFVQTNKRHIFANNFRNNREKRKQTNFQTLSLYIQSQRRGFCVLVSPHSCPFPSGFIPHVDILVHMQFIRWRNYGREYAHNAFYFIMCCAVLCCCVNMANWGSSTLQFTDLSHFLLGFLLLRVLRNEKQSRLGKWPTLLCCVVYTRIFSVRQAIMGWTWTALFIHTHDMNSKYSQNHQPSAWMQRKGSSLRECSAIGRLGSEWWEQQIPFCSQISARNDRYGNATFEK